MELDGWDNTTFRLGEDLAVRLPSADGYVPQVDKEHRWLPILAPQLPLPIPRPLAKGFPGSGFPRPWSVYRWLAGEHATVERVADLDRFATELADFLAALYTIDPTGGPTPGKHNSFRGGPLTTYDSEARDAISALKAEIDTGGATEVWEAALAARWHGPSVWIHGDITAANLLVAGGRLNAVIDFRVLGSRRPSLRRDHRVDVLFRRQPKDVPGSASSGRRDLGPRPRLGTLESPDHARPGPKGRTVHRQTSPTSAWDGG